MIRNVGRAGIPMQRHGVEYGLRRAGASGHLARYFAR